MSSNLSDKLFDFLNNIHIWLHSLYVTQFLNDILICCLWYIFFKKSKNIKIPTTCHDPRSLTHIHIPARTYVCSQSNSVMNVSSLKWYICRLKCSVYRCKKCKGMLSYLCTYWNQQIWRNFVQCRILVTQGPCRLREVVPWYTSGALGADSDGIHYCGAGKNDQGHWY